jgi:hypothetical protein
MRGLNRFGITGAIDAGGGFQNYPDDYDVIRKLSEAGHLTIRLAYNSPIISSVEERDASIAEVELRPEEFGAYCKSLKRLDFSIVALDRCARKKGIAEGPRPAVFVGG